MTAHIHKWMATTVCCIVLVALLLRLQSFSLPVLLADLYTNTMHTFCASMFMSLFMLHMENDAQGNAMASEQT